MGLHHYDPISVHTLTSEASTLQCLITIHRPCTCDMQQPICLFTGVALRMSNTCSVSRSRIGAIRLVLGLG